MRLQMSSKYLMFCTHCDRLICKNDCRFVSIVGHKCYACHHADRTNQAKATKQIKPIETQSTSTWFKSFSSSFWRWFSEFRR